MLALENKFPGICIAMMGLHPCYVKENYKAELTKLKNGSYQVYKNADGGVHIKGKNTNETGTTYTKFNNLTDAQVQYLEGQLTRRATVKTKKELIFFIPFNYFLLH